MKKRLPIALVLVLLVWNTLLSSCSLSRDAPRSQEELLQQLGIYKQKDFIDLNSCEQVQIYTVIGSQYLDLAHGYALVPDWMHSVLAHQLRNEIADCIVEQGNNLLFQLIDTKSETQVISFSIHALIYEAADLKIFDIPQVSKFVLDSMCNPQILAKERIAIMYYAQTQSDLENFPDPNQIISNFCQD